MGKSKDTMQRLMSALLTATFAATTMTPVLAGPHGHGGGQASDGKHADHSVAAPQRVTPVRTERQHFDVTPRHAAPQERVMPVRAERQRFNVAPKHVSPQRAAPQERVMPVRT